MSTQVSTVANDNIAIAVHNVSKCHLIYDTPRDRLKQFLMPRLQRMAGQRQKTYFHEFWGLKNVSFEVKRGETVGVIGRNGAGKSTLLQIICGTLTPTIGRVETKGRVAALLELGAGFNPEFTGRENVYLNAALLGLTKEEIDNRFDDIAAFADIGEFLELPVKTYSTGMSVRLAFAVQSVIDPDIFIVDEALAVGDEKFQRKCFTRLESLKNNGCSILFVSHSPTSVVELCDRALFLEAGERLMYSGAAKAVRAYQKLIYAAPEVQKELAERYRVTDQSGEVAEFQSDDLPCAGDTTGPSDAFDPGLVPETTTRYAVQGAEIEGIEIRNASDQIVNLLRPGGDYQFIITGEFRKSFPKVYFGVHIKTISGVEVTGQRYPQEGTYVENVQAGQKFAVKFGFKMAMLPGVYFVGGGVWSSEEPTCLHRMLDALMFRVISLGRAKSFGYVDVSSMEPEVILR
ncbi:ABC transporter ATP-binding protein [Rhodanobacter ginsengisoli]|uniref:ABC transporter ATP-binding protein n=1 Tax=Rhodanobacter ginsengisoli TaxID=418646 RepID=A0ABW0QQE3_9GAMM